MVITIVGHVATVSLGVKINGYAAICARLGARWTCRNRHQGKGPPERAHAGLGSTKPRYNVYPRNWGSFVWNDEERLEYTLSPYLFPWLAA